MVDGDGAVAVEVIVEKFYVGGEGSGEVEDVVAAVPGEVAGGGEAGGAEEIEDEGFGGGFVGAGERGVEGVGIGGVEGAAEGDDVGADEQAEGVSDEVGADDDAVGVALAVGGVGELGDGFDADVVVGFLVARDEEVEEIGAAAAHVEDGLAGHGAEAAEGGEAGGLGGGGGPEEGGEGVAVLFCGEEVGGEVRRDPGGHDGILGETRMTKPEIRMNEEARKPNDEWLVCCGWRARLGCAHAVVVARVAGTGGGGGACEA